MMVSSVDLMVSGEFKCYCGTRMQIVNAHARSTFVPIHLHPKSFQKKGRILHVKREASSRIDWIYLRPQGGKAFGTVQCSMVELESTDDQCCFDRRHHGSVTDSAQNSHASKEVNDWRVLTNEDLTSSRSSRRNEFYESPKVVNLPVRSFERSNLRYPSRSEFHDDDGVTRVSADEPSCSSRCAKESADIEGTGRISRRSTFAFWTVLGTIALNRHGRRYGQSVSDAKDLIIVTRSADSVAVSGRSFGGHGDLVTISTDSSGSSRTGIASGLPLWMKGDYHLCMGDGFHVQLPAGWQMRDTQGQVYGTVLRYEDAADMATNVTVLKSPTSQSRIEALGSLEDLIRQQALLLTGTEEPLHLTSGLRSIRATETSTGFHSQTSKVVNVVKPKSKQGLTYYTYEIVTNSESKLGDPMHELVSAVVNDGNLYFCRVQTPEGQWHQHTQAIAERIVDSFQITGFKIRAQI